MYIMPMQMEAEATVREARKRLKDERGHWVALRRPLGSTSLWYLFRVDDLLEKIAGQPPDEPLEAAMGLREQDGAPTLQAESAPRSFRGILLDGDQLAGALIDDREHPGWVGARPPALPGGAPPRMAPPPPEETAPVNTDGEPELFEAYPGLDAPDRVEVGLPFDLEIWLSPVPVERVEGTRVQVSLPPDVDTFQLDVQVTADGFEAPHGWRHPLLVNRHRPETYRLAVKLLPLAQEEPGRITALNVWFSYQGHLCGHGRREIRVIDPARAVTTDEERPAPGEADDVPPIPLEIPTGGGAPDLTVRIEKPDADFATGRFTCTFESPHPLEYDGAPRPIDLGKQPEAFARGLIDQIHTSATAHEDLRSTGREISDRLPLEFWDLLDQLRSLVKERPPSILFYTEESYVPWELAFMEEPFYPERPAYLGAQLPVARWLISRRTKAAPQKPMQVEEVSVIVGQYAQETGWSALPQAQKEAAWLEQRYGARKYRALLDEVRAALSPQSTAQVLHIAGHGEVDPQSPQYSGLIMEDGTRLNPRFIGGRDLPKPGPFTFLNMCQTGSGGELLGEHFSFPAAFLKLGCQGVIAPIWSVDDRIALEVAERFYSEALAQPEGEGRPLAEILRDLRARYADGGGTASKDVLTYLAYSYYGHPALKFVRVAD